MDIAERFIAWIFAYNKVLTALVLLACAAGTKHVNRAVQPHNEINIWFTRYDTALQNYYKFQREFGNDRVITLAFKDDKGILTAFYFKKTEELANALMKVDGVQDVQSVINAKDFRRVKAHGVTQIKLTNWFEGHEDYDISDGIRNSILTSPLIVNRFVNPAGTVALVVISLEPITKTDSKREVIIKRITTISSSVLGDTEVHLGGIDIITNGLNQLSRHDFPVFTGIGFILMFVMVFLLYKSVACLVLSFITTCGSIWLALIIHGLLGFKLNILTVMVPLIIITVGIIVVMHMINSYENLHAFHSSQQQRARVALKSIFYPSLFAALTTMVGFISQITSEAAVLKEFGVLTSIAVCFTFLLSFLFGSLLLPLYKNKQSPKSPWVDEQFMLFTNHLIKKSKLCWAAILIIVIVSAYGISAIKIDMYPIGYFPRHHKVVHDHEFMTRHWGDYFPVDFVLNCSDSIDLKNPTLMKAIINFDEELSAIKLVKNRFSFISVMDRFANVAYKKNLIEIVDNPILTPIFIKQFNSHISDDQSRIVNQNKTKARIIITGPLLSVRELEQNISLIDSLGKNHFKKLASLRAVGYPALYVHVMNYTFSSMFSSLLFAFVLIFAIMLVMLQNIKLAFIALAPNIFPVIVLLAVLKFLNINLDLATCTVTAIVLGISIDDTIYFLHHFQQEKLLGISTREAILKTQYHVGKVILLSSVVLFSGFAILLLASLNTVLYFGILACVATVAALIGELVLIPLILTSRRKAKRKSQFVS